MITKTTTAVILFGLIAVIGFGNAYAETPDRVTVDSFPFEITIEEGGELTLINNDHVGHGLYHQFGNEKFNETVPRGDELVITLPEFMTEANNPDGYAMYDRLNDQYSMIFVKAPYVAPPVYIPPPQPVYVEPVYVEPVAEPTPVVVIAEPLEEVNFNATSSATLGTYESISNVATFDGDVDAKALQKSLADVTADFNKSVEKIAEQKAEIRVLNENALNLVVAVDTTSLDSTISELRANNTALANDITVITADRDEWKALAENWYGVAMAQLKVMVNLLGL